MHRHSNAGYLPENPSRWKKIRLLMWKNFIQQWRHKGQTFLEILFPLLTMSLVLAYRSQVQPKKREAVNYPGFPSETLKNSLQVLGGMTMSDLYIIYSPNNEMLGDIVITALAKMFALNLHNFPEDLMPSAASEMPVSDVIKILKSYFKIQAYEKGDDLTTVYSTEEKTRTVLAAVEFSDSYKELTEFPKDVAYVLRFPERPRAYSFFGEGTITWHTDSLFPVFERPGPRNPKDHTDGPPGYVTEMFIALQSFISTEIIQKMTGVNLDYKINMRRYPHHAWIHEESLEWLKLMLPVFFIFSYSYSATNMVRAIVVEKENQLKEHMKIMGLSTSLHWTAWFWKNIIYLTLSVILIVCLLKINWFKSDKMFCVLVNTSPYILFFYLMIYMTSTVFFAFMLSSLMTQSNTATLSSGMIWFITFVPSFLLSMDATVSKHAQFFTCLLHNSAFSFGLQTIVSKESVGGIRWRDLRRSAHDHESRLTFGEVVFMLILDCFLYMLLALYFEQVVPGKFGAPKRWNFIFKKDFWTNSSKSAPGLSRVDMIPYKDTVDRHFVVRDAEPKDLETGLKIKRLSKIFGDHVAVKNLSLNIYNNQITVLLGHNGAGKTTTMSMITGNLEPTRGQIILAGYDLKKDPLMARRNVGFCPQHNVLFDELTVKEHLDFYVRLKGFDGSHLEKEITTLIAKLELEAKANTESKNLSGGQKRRLQVGIALCGRARVVVLDEPTSGMDPASRRALWDLLQAEKKDRCMILSTHFMDEADVLGDRIAIMANGKLVCIGTPHFLKQYYGVGYTLFIDKGDYFDTQTCTSLIRKHVPNAKIKEEDSVRYVTYVLPNEYTNRFEALFSDLDQNSEAIKVRDYGLNATTLEDVFIRVGADIPVNTRSSVVIHPIMELPTLATAKPSFSHVQKPTVATRTKISISDPPNDSTPRESPDNFIISPTTPLLNYQDNNTSISPSDDRGATRTPHHIEGATTRSGSNQTNGYPPRNPTQYHHSSRVSRVIIAEDKSPYTLNEVNKAEYRIQGRQLIIQHISCVWRKLWIVWSRSLPLVLLIFFVPIAALGCTLALVRFLSNLSNIRINRALSLEQGFPITETLLKFSGNNMASLGALASKAYEKSFKGKSDMKVTTVKSSFADYYLNRTRDPTNILYARKSLLVGAEFEENSATAWFSNFGYHDVATSLAMVQSAILKAYDPDANLRVYNYPLEASYRDQSNIKVYTTILAMKFGCGMAVSVGLVSATFVLFYIKEKTSQALLLQKATGLRPCVLWFSSFIFDWIWFAVTFIPITFCIIYYDVPGLTKIDELGRLFLCYMLYGIAMLPMMYYFSKFFTGPAFGLTLIFFMHIVVALICPQIVHALKQIQAKKSLIDAIDYTMQLHPLYSLVSSIMQLNKIGIIKWHCMGVCEYLKRVTPNMTDCSMKVMCELNPQDCCVRDNAYFEWKEPGVLRYLTFTVVSAVFFWVILMMYEYKLLHKLRNIQKQPPPLEQNATDEDVWQERAYVKSIVGKTNIKDILVAEDITKYYKNDFLAVNQNSFTVAGGDCFGLLGINGAGKTTTFKMLMGDETISYGDAYVCNYSVKNAMTKVYHRIGYCPQFDALFDEFTGRETLEYYCLLRGFERSKINRTVALLGNLLAFTKHLHKKTHTYSGGNKRKLSTAIALIGDIQLVFVDEPTTGVDAAAKRQVWSAIQEAQRAGRGVVLTSHSMEECEALCTRLTIMVNGKFMCIGTPQHLKNKFSTGLTLIIKMKSGDGDEENFEIKRSVKSYVNEKFKNIKIMEEHVSLITYYLQDTMLKWSEAFAIMEKAKQELKIEDYSLSQTTLEQIFLQFTKYQKQEKS